MNQQQITQSPTSLILETFQETQKKQSFLSSLAIGATSGMIGITAVYPVDLVKTRLQSGMNPSMSAYQVLRTVLKTEGVRSLYKGLGPQLCGTIPDKAVSLATRDFLREKFSNPANLLAIVLSSAGAGVTQSVVMNPVEIVKVRMQIDSRTNPTTIFKDLGMRGLYRGYSACISRDVAFAVSYFTLYEITKQKLEINETSNISIKLLAASIAGIPAAFLTTPLDVIKTRMQAGNSTQSFMQIASTIKAQHGMKAFFSGWGPRVGRISPQFGIVLVSYDYLTWKFN